MKLKTATLVHDDAKIKELIRKLAEAEAAIETYFENQVDAILDPMKGSLILLRQAQEALLEEVRYHHMASILQNVTDGIIVTDMEGKITYWNEGATAIHGRGPEEMLGRSLSSLPSGAGAETFMEDLKTVRDGKEFRLEWEGKDAAGTPFWIESRMTLMHDVRGNPTGFMRVEKDITERKRSEEHLRQAQKLEALGTLSGGIAHDFNNILATIITNCELALFDLPARSPFQPNLDAILKAGIRGRDLVRQILTFSRKSETQRKRINLAAVVRETYNFLRASLPATIEMHFREDQDSGYVDADPVQIQQIITNLGTNAAYAMREKGGKLDISIKPVRFGAGDLLPDEDMAPGEYLALSVEDTGQGMDETVRKRIFEPFFSTKPAGEGTGLGLAVVYGIVKSHGGGISVYSEPGQGSVFAVYLPKAGPPPQASEDIPQEIPRGRERILFVDDEEMIVNAACHMMKSLGYKVTALTDSREALALFSRRSSDFDLVITDQTMPFMTGEELAREMIRMRPDVSIILCTGHSEKISSEKARAMGIRGFIMKPFTVLECAQLLRQVLDDKERD